MEVRIIWNIERDQYASVPQEHKAALRNALQTELLMCIEAAMEAEKPLIIFNAPRQAQNQLITEFEVKDTECTVTPRYNFHGQNVSQWVYAGCVLYDGESGRVSRHH